MRNFAIWAAADILCIAVSTAHVRDTPYPSLMIGGVIAVAIVLGLVSFIAGREYEQKVRGMHISYENGLYISKDGYGRITHTMNAETHECVRAKRNAVHDVFALLR